MKINDIYEFIDKIRIAYENTSIDYVKFFFDMIFLIILFCIFYDIKVMDIFKKGKYLVQYCITGCLTFLGHITVGSIAVFVPIVCFFCTHLILSTKIGSVFNNIVPETENTTNAPSTPILSKTSDRNENKNDDIPYKINKLGKDNNFNIIDVLFIYDYISDYQRRKIIQSLICENTDNMACKLLETYTITEEELKEAKAILNLIGLEGRLVTKEEAIMCLIKNKKEGEGND
jgi:hypothetical protein